MLDPSYRKPYSRGKGIVQVAVRLLGRLPPLELAAPAVRPALEMAARGAHASGTPFVSFFTPARILALAIEAGFGNAYHVCADDLANRYFAGRTDGLRPPRNAEELLIATT